MATKKKKQWGGARKGSGRKETGVNTVPVHFTFHAHKDWAAELRPVIKAAYKNFKEQKENGAPPILLNQVKPAPKPINSTKTPAVNKFLENRRKSKFEIK